VPAAVIFDLDGVLADSEQLWNQAKRELVQEAGGQWLEQAPRDMMGMSSPEWSAYMRDQLGVPLELDQVNREVIGRMEALYREHLPLLPGAVESVRAIAAEWPAGLASSSNREIIDLFLGESGLRDAFAATVSSEEVHRGKPAPDVYLEAARRLSVAPAQCVAVEDSSNGLRSAHAAGMRVIGVPNQHYPPEPDALELAASVVRGVGEVTPELIRHLPGRWPPAARRDFRPPQGLF
jgi:HAD superfamily hydrolase (TIGR01509 family)